MYQSDEDAIPINLIHLVPRSPNIDPSNVVMKQQIPSTNYLSLFRGIWNNIKSCSSMSIIFNIEMHPMHPISASTYNININLTDKIYSIKLESYMHINIIYLFI